MPYGNLQSKDITYKLVGTFLLEKISEICNKSNIGLYRDDGLSIFRNKSGTQLEKMKKKLQRLFKEYDLEITAESNLKIVNYLDVTFNLKDGTFRPYHKPDDQIQYIHTESNHPPNIIKHIPASIETRLLENIVGNISCEDDTEMTSPFRLDTITL